MPGPASASASARHSTASAAPGGGAWPASVSGRGEAIDALRDTVRGSAADEIAPRAEEIDRTNQFPRDLWPRMGELGLHGITVEEEYGGSGLGYLEHCIA